ncbi:prealbumin-like fold domain-containing protein [Lysobacter enzymogenes]|uniref:prealbumin-like fold domain-containing protein n=1 Tax=Lysobacter enzymogenes TaxID=69 RepID=UPI001A96FF49|nr:DUF11 domain-containing protein [Lysobacter enzymogenes]QQP96890.1 hypothetical protein JHW38_02215 [Lysobacter enzymogenes]
MIKATVFLAGSRIGQRAMSWLNGAGAIGRGGDSVVSSASAAAAQPERAPALSRAVAACLAILCISSLPIAAAQAQVNIFTENFNNGNATSTGAVRQAAPGGGRPTYIGPASNGSMTYTADAGWVTGCNDLVISWSSPIADANAVASCGSQSSYNYAQQLVYGVGAYNANIATGTVLGAGGSGSMDLGLTAYTSTSTPGPNTLILQNAVPIALPTANIPVGGSGRFVTFRFVAGATSCPGMPNGTGALSPVVQFLLNGSALGAGNINICTGGVAARTYTSRPRENLTIGPVQVRAATFYAPGADLETTNLTFRIVNQQGAGGGNDWSYDNLALLDVTPSITKAASTATLNVGATRRITFTITNTSGDNLRKQGWDFTDTLPGSVVIAATPNVANACGGTVTAAAGSGTFTLTDGDLPAGTPGGTATTCTVAVDVVSNRSGTFTNDQASYTSSSGLNIPVQSVAMPWSGNTLTVVKVSSNGTASFSFTGNNGINNHNITTTASGVPGTAGATQILTGASTTSPTTVSESALSGWAVSGTPSCTGMPAGVSSTYTAATRTITIGAMPLGAGTGSNVTCTFTNRPVATVTVTKISNGGTGTFDFTGSNGIQNHSITTTASGGTGTVGAQQTLTATGTQTTVTESTPPTGYALSNIQCTGLGAGGTATPDLPTRTVTLNAAATAVGSNIACTFTNQASAGVTLKKSWTNGKANDAVSLSITGGSGAVGGSSIAGGTSTDATATANVGATVTLTEAFTTGAAGNYTTTLACVDANSATVAVTGTGLSRTITMPSTAVTCTYANSRIAQQLNLAKSWSAGATSGHTATATTTGGTNNATFNSTAPSTGLTGTAVTVYAGDSVTLPAETFGGGATAANYGAAVACTGGTTLASTTTLPQTITVAANTTATTCTYTNTVATAGVTLKKSWTNGKANDAVSLSITGGSGAVGGSSIAGGTSTDATATANVGATVTLTEAFTTGAAGNYTTTLACVDANSATVAVTGTGLSRTITMPATAVTCTYANSRIAQQLNLAKSWGAGATSGHTAAATTTGGTNNATFSSTAPSTGLTGTAVTMYAGDVVTLPAETFGGGATASNYSVAVACTGGSPLASGAAGRQVTIAANTTATTCTYTNTVATAGVTLKKSWTNGKANDAVSLSITGGSGAVGGSSTAGGTSTDATATANVGATVTLTEAFTTGAAGNYTSTLACVDANSATVTVTGTGLSRTITMPSTAVTCTYTNSRIAQQLNLAKSWGAGATSGHTAAATTTGGTNNATFSSTAPSTGLTGTAVTMYAGDVVTLPAETFGGGATASNYSVAVACTGGSLLASGAAGRQVTIAANTTATTCTYTNTVATAGVTLKKSWTNGKANDAVSLSITGGSGAVGGNSIAGGTSTDATATANVGATVTLTEAFTTGAAGNYTTTLACVDANSATVAVTGTGLSRTITMPATAVTCTYTNSRIAQQLNLAKSWGSGATSGHTATATTTGGTNNATFNSTAPSTGLTGTAVTVYAGDSVTLPAETFGGGATAANYSAAVACTGGTTLASTATLPQTVTVTASATATTCTYTNTVATTGVTLKKTWTNGKASDAVSLSITGGSGAVGGSSIAGGTSTDATATANVGATITLVESFTTGAAANYTTTLACVDANSATVTVTGTGLSRTITMPATAVTCTYTNSRIAQQLNLAKSWGAGAISGHTAGATTSGGSNNATFNSTAPSTGLTGTAVTMYAGDVVTLPVETFGGGATAANYGAAVACTGGTTLASTTTLPQTITVAASAAATTCTYTNTLNSADLSVTKTNDAASVIGGGTTTYSVVVTNHGGNAVVGAVVRDTPVAGLSACQVTACTPGGACPAQPSDLLSAGGATLGALAAGAQAKFTVTCNVDP